MKCPKCGKKLYSDTLTRCPFCGSEIESEEKDKVSHKEEMELLFSNDKGVTARGVSHHHAPNIPPQMDLEADDDIPTFSEPPVHVVKKQEKPQPIAVSIAEADAVEETPIPSSVSEKVVADTPKRETRPVNAVSSVQTEAVDNSKPEPVKQPQIDNNAPREVHVEAEASESVSGESNGGIESSPSAPLRQSKLQQLLGRRKKKNRKEATEKANEVVTEVSEQEEIESEEPESGKDAYDSNADGYYDDLIPDLAKEINKIPQENIIKVVIMAVFGVIAMFVILTVM